MASLGGVYYTFQNLGEKLWGPARRLIEYLLGVGATTAIVIAVIGVALLFLVGWIVSIVMTVVHYYGFTLRRQDDRLRRRYGLFTQVETVVPLRRIQVLRLQAPLLRRLFSMFTVYAETAGSAKEDEKTGGSAPLSPLIRRADAARFCRLAFPDFDLDGVDWQSVSRLTIRRGFIRAAIILLMLIGLVAFVERTAADPGIGAPAVVGAKLLWFIPVAMLLAAWWAMARYRSLGYAETERFLLARCGIGTRKIWVIPKAKIQSLFLNQSPMQRRLTLATLRIDTAGTESLSDAQIVDLPYNVAATLQDRLSRTANDEGLWLPDGV